jgi:hypothetical protein
VDLGLLIADLCSTELFLTDEAYESVLTRVRSALIFKKKKKKPSRAVSLQLQESKTQDGF